MLAIQVIVQIRLYLNFEAFITEKVLFILLYEKDFQTVDKSERLGFAGSLFYVYVNLSVDLRSRHYPLC
jgi:hypothetical protein